LTFPAPPGAWRAATGREEVWMFEELQENLVRLETELSSLRGFL
jgi:hypothetical protein